VDKSLSGTTLEVLTRVPWEWTLELTVRHRIVNEWGRPVTMPSIVQRLLHLEKRGKVERRWMNFERQIRRVPQTVEAPRGE
jgi:hypothetical protein